MLIAPLQAYLRAPRITAGSARAFLRAAFASAFLAQVLFAALVGVAVRSLAGGVRSAPSPVLGWALVIVALVQLPVMFLASQRVGVSRGHGVSEGHGASRGHGASDGRGAPQGHGARRAALSASLLSGVLLATSVWFLALALAAGQSGTPLFVLLALVLLSYSAGFLAVGRLGGIAATETFEQSA